MNDTQKDSMLEVITKGIQFRILYLLEMDMVEESQALYKEWENHLDDRITEVEIITINDLTCC